MILEIVVPLIVILVFGLPHGAADGILVYQAMNAELIKFFSFLLFYISFGILVIICWYFFPLISLGVFLIISSIHFGIMDMEGFKNKSLRYLRVMIHGSTIVLIIPFSHPIKVKNIFDLLVGHDTSMIFIIINIIFYFWLAGALIIIIYSKSERFQVFLEISIISSLGIFLPPLWGFAVYFCGIHSLRHFQNLWSLFKKKYTWNHAISSTLVVSIISLLLVISVAWVAAYDNLTNSLIRATFIGLAAFTVPHVLLIDTFGVIRRLYKSQK